MRDMATDQASDACGRGHDYGMDVRRAQEPGDTARLASAGAARGTRQRHRRVRTGERERPGDRVRSAAAPPHGAAPARASSSRSACTAALAEEPTERDLPPSVGRGPARSRARASDAPGRPTGVLPSTEVHALVPTRGALVGSGTDPGGSRSLVASADRLAATGAVTLRGP